MTILTKTITAQATGTDWLDATQVPAPYQMSASLDVGSATTLHVQRKRAGEADSLARDVPDAFAAVAITGDKELEIVSSGKWLWRIFCKTGNYGAASMVSIELP